MPTTRATELAQVGSLVTADPSTSTVTVGGTLTATTLAPSNNAVTTATINDSAVTTAKINDGAVTAAKLSNPQYTGFRNRIINGDMRIDQRNAGSAVTGADGAYPVDRFLSWSNLGGVSRGSFQQNSGGVTPPSGFKNYLGFVSSGAYAPTTNESFGIQQRVEGYNIADLDWGSANAKTVTLSFWVRSSLTGLFGGSLTNNGYSRGYVFNYTINFANTWEYKTITIVGDTSGTWESTNGLGVLLLFSLGAHSSKSSSTPNTWGVGGFQSQTGAVNVLGTNGATFYITGVQLEAGSTATDFERRPYGTELSLCQRYYYKAITGTNFNQLAFCNVRTTTSHYAFLQLPVKLRSNPTSIDYSGIGIISYWGQGVEAVSSLTFADPAYGSGTTQVLLNAVTSNAIGTVGQVSMLLGNNSSTGYVALNSEL